MNLWFLAREGARPFYRLAGDVTLTAVGFGQAAADVGTYNALSLAPGAAIRLPNASGWYPINRFQSNVGWIAAAPDSAELSMAFVRGEETSSVAVRRYTLGRVPIPVLLPIKPDKENSYDLLISAPERNTCVVQLGVMENIRHEGG